MEVSPKDGSDSGDSAQGNPAGTVGNQSQPSRRQDASENQDSRSSESMSSEAGSQHEHQSPSAAEGTAQARGVRIVGQEGETASDEEEEAGEEAGAEGEEAGAEGEEAGAEGEEAGAEGEEAGAEGEEAGAEGEEASEEEASNSPDEQACTDSDLSQSYTEDGVSKYVSNARTLLLGVLEEMMKMRSDGAMYVELVKCIQSVAPKDESSLISRLETYGEIRETGLVIKYAGKPEYDVREQYEKLVKIVIKALTYTISRKSSERFEGIMKAYRSSQRFYKEYATFSQGYRIPENLDDNLKRKITSLQKRTERLLIQTRNAFRELLIHVGEHDEEEHVSAFETEVDGEDLKCLRRRIDTSDDSREGTDAEGESRQGIDAEGSRSLRRIS